jgi:hypothetical protein
MSLFGTPEQFTRALKATAGRKLLPPLQWAEERKRDRELFETIDSAVLARTERENADRMRNVLVAMFETRFTAPEISEVSRQRYKADLAKFRDWCVKEKVSYLPADPAVIAHYLMHACITENKIKVALAKRICNAINAGHRVKDLLPPCEHQFVKTTIAWLKEETTIKLPDPAKPELKGN